VTRTEQLLIEALKGIAADIAAIRHLEELGLEVIRLRCAQPSEPAPCPDGVENCPGDCTGTAKAEYLRGFDDGVYSAKKEYGIEETPYFDTLEIAQPCPECGRDPHDPACPKAP